MKPSLSVIIPVYNGSRFIKDCLQAVKAAADDETEIILVNDGSTDDTEKLARNLCNTVISLQKSSGSATARNIGVSQSNGELILFVDVDVIIQPDAIQNLRSIFSQNPDISAVFGSYDAMPGETDFFSQYRNLMHHFFHQTGSQEAETFWSGFGAIRRQAFLQVGGFNGRKYKVPAIEDIELGYRLRQKGCRILLDPTLQAKHLKKWSFYSILRNDFWFRAVPWTEILLLNPQVKHDLNVKPSEKISALLAGLFALSLVFSFFQSWAILIALLSFILFMTINRNFYSFFLKSRNLWFTIRVFPMHLLLLFLQQCSFCL
jgi:glycosyltransferase involved in cell wall biosynthesis